MEAEAPAKEHRSYKKIVANQEVAVLARSCMCGRIAYEVDAAAGPIIHCHCQTCRKAHATAFSSRCR